MLEEIQSYFGGNSELRDAMLNVQSPGVRRKIPALGKYGRSAVFKAEAIGF